MLDANINQSVDIDSMPWCSQILINKEEEINNKIQSRVKQIINIEKKYNTKYGVYSKNCGLENVKMSWGHDEYLYQILKNILYF